MIRVKLWREQIAKSTDEKTKIDISHEFERIFSRNIITIALGEDISDNHIDITIFEDDGSEYVKGCSVRESIHHITI